MADEPGDVLTDQEVYDKLLEHQDAGIIKYVLPSIPLGEKWVLGIGDTIRTITGKGEAVAFLAGINEVLRWYQRIMGMNDIERIQYQNVLKRRKMERLASQPLPSLVPAADGDRYMDADGHYHSPVTAAMHAVEVQGGFTTPEREAYRMLADGGIGADRARTWLTENDLPLTAPDYIR